MSAVEATKIYQRVLDAVSDAVLRADHVTIGSYLSRPFHMRTVNGWFPLNTDEDIEQMVKSTHFSLKVQGATDYVRIASSAEFLANGIIDGIHTTHILRNGTKLVPSYESRMQLEKFGNDWKVTTAKHSMDNSKWPITLPSIKRGDLATVEQSAEVDEIAIACYQEYLDHITAINVSGIFEDWLDACEFPHKVQIDRTDRIIESRDDIEPFFTMITDMLTTNPDATLKRTADYAGFLDSHTLRGYHTATLASPDAEVFPPVHSRMTIRFSRGKWRMIEVVNSIANTEFPYTKPIVSDHLSSEFHYPKKDIK